MIITFYSYKGGVGRSQLLANLAVYFSMFEYKKILLIDWDLEAPGIHFYFDKTTKEVNKHGLLDILQDYTKLRQTEKYTKNKNNLPKFTERKHITKLVEYKKPNSKIKGHVSLITAGKNQDTKEFQQNVIDFNWNEFYELLDGKRYLEHLKNEIRKLDYDYVFIDSRTGINDYADICNIQMPDVNFLIAAPTKQNFAGIKNFAHRIMKSPYIKNGNYRKSIILPIISRVEIDSPDFSEFFAEFKELFSFLIKNIETHHKEFVPENYTFFKDTMLTYNKFVAIGENILFKNNKEEIYGLAKQYQNIIRYIKFLNNKYDTTTLQQKLYGKIKIPAKTNNYIKWHNIGNEYFELKEYTKAIETFQKSIDLKPDFLEARNNISKAFLKTKNYDEAIKYLKQNIEIQPDNENTLFNLARYYSLIKNKEQAIKYLKKCLEIDSKFGELAIKDEDYKYLWEDRAFIEITK